MEEDGDGEEAMEPKKIQVWLLLGRGEGETMETQDDDEEFLDEAEIDADCLPNFRGPFFYP